MRLVGKKSQLRAQGAWLHKWRRFPSELSGESAAAELPMTESVQRGPDQEHFPTSINFPTRVTSRQVSVLDEIDE